MRTQLRPNEDQSLAALVREIVDDAQTILRREILLAKTEFREEWLQGKRLLTLGAMGLVFSFYGVGLLALAISQLLITSGFEFWVAYGLCSLVFVAVGTGFFIVLKLNAKPRNERTLHAIFQER